ncbi:MAG TPA: DEAD/DEAH box helicase [Candidatus Limiplasma sp.]|nr:DEAD/DEAH box helicase [Candidatus Limiplasma sp.]HPS81020.1 DEAD/DEAH box helicase [Candidatus Limiplasma sp.]
MSEWDDLPPYLAVNVSQTSAEHTFGTLSYNAKRNCWLIKADPNVTELCKRLFPGSATNRRGEARITAHRRMVGDLNWLMLRYPLEIKAKDAQRWQSALTDAREYARKRQNARLAPQRVTPEPSVFVGTLTAFQEEGLAFLLRTDRCLLADEMGLGKTVQALAMLSELNAYPAMVIAPAHLLRNWENEIARFLRKPDGSALTVHIVKGLTPYILPPADIYLMHYLLLRGWKEALPEIGIRHVVFDEIQELRHSGTEKYSAASLLAENAERVVGLSGTPIYNRGAEIWNVINTIDYHFLGDYESFTREWCYGYGNQIVAKPELLGDYLRGEGLMLRRTKQDVLADLPPKRRLVMTVDSDDSLYRKLMAPVEETLRQLKHDAALTASQRAILSMEVEQGERQATGIAKAPYVAQFVRALLEGGEKVLLFAHHHQVMDLYQKELKGFSPAFITGRETAVQKERSLERFMAGRTDLCCVSLRAASGLNLQRASCVVFGELDWSPAVHSQAEDRAHRMGQADSILCYYLVAGGGSDQDIQDALGLKVSQFVALMGDQPQTQETLNENTQYAKQYTERLIRRLLDEVS